MLSIYRRTVAGHQLSDKLEIFCWELISVVHEFNVLFPNTSFYCRWHFQDAQFCISYRKKQNNNVGNYTSQSVTEHALWNWSLDKYLLTPNTCILIKISQRKSTSCMLHDSTKCIEINIPSSMTSYEKFKSHSTFYL